VRIPLCETTSPEAAEIRTQEEVRAQGDKTTEDQGPGGSRVQEALQTVAVGAEETGVGSTCTVTLVAGVV
jgi:hypothetical protein